MKKILFMTIGVMAMAATALVQMVTGNKSYDLAFNSAGGNPHINPGSGGNIAEAKIDDMLMSASAADMNTVAYHETAMTDTGDPGGQTYIQPRLRPDQIKAQDMPRAAMSTETRAEFRRTTKADATTGPLTALLSKLSHAAALAMGKIRTATTGDPGLQPA